MVNVDISNVWGEISLPDLLALEAEVFAAHNALVEGTEAGSLYRGWLKLPEREDTDSILDAAQRIRETSDVLVVLGNSGAVLGTRGILELLQGPDRNLGKAKGDPEIFFAGADFSGRSWKTLLHRLEGKDISLCVVSKSGETLETGVALRGLRWMLERKYGTEEARKRIVAVTDEKTGPLQALAAEENWEVFPIPENVSGDYALLSAAGLLPLAVAGVDIRQLQEGAGEAKRALDLRSYENPAWLYGAVRCLMGRSGKAAEWMQVFDPYFGSFGQWWQRLYAGCGGPVPVAAQAPGDLHGLGQLAVNGQSLFETLVTFREESGKVSVLGDVKNLDGLNYLEDKTLEELTEGAYQAGVESLSDAGISVVSIECDEICEKNLGGLIWFFQLGSCLSGYLQGKDPFDCSGGEKYQERLGEILGKPADSQG